MKIEIEIEESKLAEHPARHLATGNWMFDAVGGRVRIEAQRQIGAMDVDALVREYLERRIEAVLDDVLSKQLRHVVKLAVDRELAVARLQGDLPLAPTSIKG